MNYGFRCVIDIIASVMDILLLVWRKMFTVKGQKSMISDCRTLFGAYSGGSPFSDPPAARNSSNAKTVTRIITVVSKCFIRSRDAYRLEEVA